MRCSVIHDRVNAFRFDAGSHRYIFPDSLQRQRSFIQCVRRDGGAVGIDLLAVGPAVEDLTRIGKGVRRQRAAVLNRHRRHRSLTAVGIERDMLVVILVPGHVLILEPAPVVHRNSRRTGVGDDLRHQQDLSHRLIVGAVAVVELEIMSQTG